MKFSVGRFGEGFENLVALNATKKRVGYSTLDKLVRDRIIALAEIDKRRGSPFLQPTRVISNDYKIKYNERIELMGDEIAWKVGLLDDVDIFNGSPVEEDEGVEKEERVVEKAERVMKPVTETPPPNVNQPKGVSQSKPSEVDADALWSTLISTQGKQVKEKELDTRNVANLVEFVRNNNGCTVREALKFFTVKEINKQVRLGRVFKKNGRLSI